MEVGLPDMLDLVGKGGHIRTIPVPDWVKQTISCYQRRPLLGTVRARNLFVKTLGEVRAKRRLIAGENVNTRTLKNHEDAARKVILTVSLPATRRSSI
jgi:hypothetical protein